MLHCFWINFLSNRSAADKVILCFTGQLKWSDIKQLLIYLIGLSWRLVCLVRYLNPVHYAWARMRAPSFRHVDLQGVYYPTFKERMRSYFKSGQYLTCITIPLPVTRFHRSTEKRTQIVLGDGQSVVIVKVC